MSGRINVLVIVGVDVAPGMRLADALAHRPKDRVDAVDLGRRALRGEAALAETNDLLERRVAARTAELAASEARFRSSIEAAPMAVFVCDRAGRFVDLNPAAAELFGRDAKTLFARALADVIADEARTATWQTIVAADGAEQRQADLCLLRADGELIWAALRTTRLDGDRTLVFCRDTSNWDSG